MEKTILVIDDEGDIREAMVDAVTQSGFSVLEAENGEVGLEKALANKPDLILLDIKMPVMDGHQFLAKLRQDNWGKTVKVIMLTSMDDVKNIGEAHTGDITDYLIKAHSSLEDILGKIKEVLFT